MKTPLLCLVVTVILYFANRKLHARFPRFWLSPVVLTPLLLVSWVVFSGIAYSAYARGTGFLVWLLGPATVAFAVPIYEHRVLLRQHYLLLTAGTVTGICVSLSTAWVLSRAMHLPPEIAHTLLVRSISTPFAMVLSPEIGGSAELAALLVVLTGVFGMLIGEGLLAWLPLRSRLAIGIPMGAAAHGIGTVKAYRIGTEEGVVASLTMVFSGVLMVLAGPWLVWLFL